MTYQPIQDNTRVIVHTMRGSFSGIILESDGMSYKIKLDNGCVDWYGRYQIDPDRSQIWRSARSV
jgi:hypothetical protein